MSCQIKLSLQKKLRMTGAHNFLSDCVKCVTYRWCCSDRLNLIYYESVESDYIMSYISSLYNALIFQDKMLFSKNYSSHQHDCCGLMSKCSSLDHTWYQSYLTPRNLGCSPGADVSVSIFRLSMWAMEITVAATYHGRPMKEQTISRTATQNRSRW